MTTIIDLMSARPGTEGPVWERVARMVPQGEKVEVHLLASQQGALQLPGADSDVTLVPVDDATVESDRVASLAGAIQRLMGADEAVRVLSFSPAVKHLVSALRRAYPTNLRFEPLAPYARMGSEAPFSHSWDPNYMPEEEAVAAVVRAIAMSRRGELYKTDLRPVLETLDSRFSKSPGSFAGSPGFVSALITLAEVRGLVQTHGVAPRVRVALTAEGQRLATTDAPATEFPQGGAAPEEPERKSRSSQFSDSLWEAGLGPFMNVRTAVYDEIDRAISEGPKPLKALLTDAIKAARLSQSQVDEKFPWSKVRLFLEKVMTRHPVTVADEGPIAPTWTNGGTRINKMADDWQLSLDGVLVLHLVDEGFGLTVGDLADLAGALYNGRGEEELDRAHAVVERLIGDGTLADVAPEEPLRRKTPSVEALPDQSATG